MNSWVEFLKAESPMPRYQRWIGGLCVMEVNIWFLTRIVFKAFQ